MDIEAMLQSSDREERIAARRARVQARLAAQREGEQDGAKKEIVVEKEIGKGLQQMFESRKRIEKIKDSGTEVVTLVRAESDDRENKRRIEEETRRQELRTKLLHEAEISARKNVSVAMGWSTLLNLATPEGLDEEIQRQRGACERIISSKDSIIDEMKAELKLKDDEYVKALKRQAQDIDAMLKHMAVQIAEVQQGIWDELGEVETAFLQERSELLQKNKEELTKLLERRGKQEQAFMELQLERADGFQQELEDLRVQDAEDYNILKVKLEKDIQNLEQHLEAMRATYQLNTEKLEYNYRVLVEREQENQSTISAQKRKVARQRDILSTLKGKYAASDKRYQTENTRLTEEYKRITEQFKDLQGKFKHFEVADVTRYKEIWDMNAGVVAELITTVLKADRVIHDQILGWEHVPPSEEVFKSPMDEEEQQQAAEDQTAAEAEAQLKRKELMAKIMDSKFAPLLEKVISTVPFLQDPKYPSVEAILKALGVTDGKSFDALIDSIKREIGDTTAPNEAELLRTLRQHLEAESKVVRATKGIAQITGRETRRLQRTDKEKEYWERMANVISGKMKRIWEALEREMGGYNELLQKRSKILDEIDILANQNTELRSLLNQYLSSKINEELQVPPTQML